MAAFTDRNEDHYFETELSTVQTNVSQPRFRRTSLGINTEIVELINTEFEIPQNNLKYMFVPEELQVLVSSMKNRIFLFKSIYCKHRNNYIITVQHSPLLVQYTNASA